MSGDAAHAAGELSLSFDGGRSLGPYSKDKRSPTLVFFCVCFAVWRQRLLMRKRREINTMRYDCGDSWEPAGRMECASLEFLLQHKSLCVKGMQLARYYSMTK